MKSPITVKDIRAMIAGMPDDADVIIFDRERNNGTLYFVNEIHDNAPTGFSGRELELVQGDRFEY